MSNQPTFFLTPQQQELLFTALSANKPSASDNGLAELDSPPTATTQPTDLSKAGFEDSSYLDYDYPFDGADSSLDFSLNDNSQLTFADGALDGMGNDDMRTESVPSSADNDSPDKRSHPDDVEDEAAGAKRREAGDKVPKKPGRKPLTSEPSSKRKAQNRAAQRAFRERKEKHVKDLEDKVAQLEKTAEAASSENGLLRAQVEKMTVQLNEYKKQLSIVSGTHPSVPVNGQTGSRNTSGFNSINDVSFQFEFPKFGQLPGPHNPTNNQRSSTAASSSKSTPQGTAVTSPVTGPNGSTPATTSSNHNSPPESFASSPNKSTKDQTFFAAPRTSLDSTSTNSPSASSNSMTAPSSSCGTSPESCNQSPLGFKPLDPLSTIGEEQPTMFAPTNPLSQATDLPQLTNIDINSVNWLGSQGNFQFDPQLFGDYREPQDNVLASGGFDESFFNDALDIDFTTPFNVAPSPVVYKQNLIAQIDAAKDGDFSSSSIPPASIGAAKTETEKQRLLTCTKIWERLQKCPKVQNGDFDLDGLCSDLQKKAKCSGSGAVVDEKEFKDVMNKYLGKGNQSCVDDMASGIAAGKV